MKAALLYKIGSPLVIEDIPIPQIRTTDVLVQVKACGICSTDRYILNGARPISQFPHILGHEGTGVVAKVGGEVKRFAEGDRVLMDCIISCGNCYYCSGGRDNLCSTIRKLIGISSGFPGAYAEYVKVPERNLFLLPEEISFQHGVIITSILSTAFHAVRRGDIVPSDTVVVYGCGPIGLSIIQLVILYGATKIIGIDILKERLELAKKAGATHTINAKQQDPVSVIQELTNGSGAHVVFEVVGDEETILRAVQSVCIGGQVILVGVQFKPIQLRFDNYFGDINYKELSIMSIWGYQRREFPVLIELAMAKKIDFSHAILREMPLDMVNEGMEISKKGDIDRVIIVP